MVNVAPQPRARKFSDVDAGKIIVTKFAGQSVWCLKCLWQGDTLEEFALLLGPHLPADFSSPSYIEVGPETRTLDFGSDYTLDLSTDTSDIALALPNRSEVGVGVVLIEDQYYLRFGSLGPTEDPMYLRLSDSHLTYELPRSPERAFFSGWRFRLEGIPTSKEQLVVCQWPPPNSDAEMSAAATVDS